MNETVPIHDSLTGASQGFDRATPKLRFLTPMNPDTVTPACPECVFSLLCVYRL
jgi:hypothetical protein